MQNIGTAAVDNTADWSVRRYKDTLAVYRNIARVFIAISVTLLTVCLALAYKIYVMQNEYADAETQITDLTSTLDITENTLSITENALDALEEKYEVLVDATEKFQTVIDEMNAENAKVVKANKKLRKQLTKFEEREELYNKYEYALYTKMGTRTDLTYDQVATGEELMVENGMDPDLLFGIIMTESGGDETAANTTSTARGYGQILKSSGVLIYEKLQGHGSGTYTHSMAYDGDTNISMIVTLLAYFRDKGYSLDKAINCYRGLDDSSYKKKINSYIATAGNSLTQIAANW
jgi:regulator of replication initiation timing